MTTDAKGLRNKVVKAMAQASYDRARQFYGGRWDSWDILSNEERRQWVESAEAALDAALDVLESSPSNDDWKLLTDALLTVSGGNAKANLPAPLQPRL